MQTPINHKHPDVQALIHNTVKMCLDTVQTYPDMSLPQRSASLQSTNRLLEIITEKESHVIHSHYHNSPDPSGPENVEVVARHPDGDEFVAAQARGA